MIMITFIMKLLLLLIVIEQCISLSIISTTKKINYHNHQSHYHHQNNKKLVMITDITRSLFPSFINPIVEQIIHPIVPILPIVKTTEAIPLFKSFLLASNSGELLVFILFSLTYKRALRWAHKIQVFTWQLLALGIPLEWERSMLGFMQDRAGLLGKLMGFNYIVKIVFKLLIKIGFRIRPDFPSLLSRVSYAIYIANFVDLFKGQFLKLLFPSLGSDRRQNYVVNRSSSVAVWVVLFFVACEMISTYLKVPLSSTLALGGVGGLALGLSARDIAANFLGGMLLLFNEPFVPGDMVTFKTGSSELIGRVERVGWGQTRIRGRDTRPTYVPNSHFVQTAVTNMERITHRKFEAIVPLRFQDQHLVQDVLIKIKDALRTIPKLDVLSMPFRVSFVKFGTYSLDIEITCFFATKSIDEFLALQQIANLEILKVIRECGAQLALPTSNIVGLPQQLNGIPPQTTALPQQPPQVPQQQLQAPQQTSLAPQPSVINAKGAMSSATSNSASANTAGATARKIPAQSPTPKLPPPLVPPPIAKQTAQLEQRRLYSIGQKQYRPDPQPNISGTESFSLPLSRTQKVTEDRDILAGIVPPLSGTIFSPMSTMNPGDSNYLFKAKVLQGHESLQANDKNKINGAMTSNSVKDTSTNSSLKNNKKTVNVENPPVRNSLFALEQEFLYRGDANDDDEKWIETDTLYGEW